MTTRDEIDKAFEKPAMRAVPAAAPAPWPIPRGRVARQQDARHALTLMAAHGGGYMVATATGEGMPTQFLFAGTLQRCLAYMHSNIVHDADVTAALAELPTGPVDG